MLTKKQNLTREILTVILLLAAVAATSSPRSRASSWTMCGRNAGSLRRSLDIGFRVRGSR